MGWFRCALRPCDVVIHVSGWLSAPWGDAAPTVSLEGYGSEGLPVLRVVVARHALPQNAEAPAGWCAPGAFRDFRIGIIFHPGPSSFGRITPVSAVVTHQLVEQIQRVSELAERLVVTDVVPSPDPVEGDTVDGHLHRDVQ